MIFSVFVFALLCAASALPVDDEDKRHFESWRNKYNKVYSPSEYYERLQIFTQTKRKIDKHNERNASFTMALNQFSDMTFSEFRKLFLMSAPQNCSATKANYVGSNMRLPDSIDWRKKGNFVTPVKQQGGCGSCWTFSTTGCLESVTAIHTGKLVPLSEQQLVDCAQDFNNHGCEGGLPSQAFEYIMYNKGLMTEEDYPYKAIQGACQYQPGKAAAAVADVMNITAYKESEIEDAVGTKNPVSFAFEVVDDFMSYSGGVYTSNECHKTEDKVNHAVLAVGYGEQNGKPYWIVKNSWGENWGIEGYFLIERGKNMCGLAACASFPAV